MKNSFDSEFPKQSPERFQRHSQSTQSFISSLHSKLLSLEQKYSDFVTHCTDLLQEPSKIPSLEKKATLDFTEKSISSSFEEAVEKLNQAFGVGSCQKSQSIIENLKNQVNHQVQKLKDENETYKQQLRDQTPYSTESAEFKQIKPKTPNSRPRRQTGNTVSKSFDFNHSPKIKFRVNRKTPRKRLHSQILGITPPKLKDYSPLRSQSPIGRSESPIQFRKEKKLYEKSPLKFSKLFKTSKKLVEHSRKIQKAVELKDPDLEVFLKKCEKTRSDLTKLFKLIQSEESKNIEINTEISIFETEELKKKIGLKNQKVKELKDSLELLKKENQELRNFKKPKHSSLGDSCKEISSELQKIKDNLNQYKDLENKLGYLKTENKTLKEANTQALSSLVTPIKQNLAAYENLGEEFQTAFDKILSKVTNSTLLVKRFLKSTKNSQETRMIPQKELQNLVPQKTQNLLDSLTKENSQLKSQITEYQTQVEELQQYSRIHEVFQLVNEKNQLEKNLSDLKEERTKQEHIIYQLNQNLEHLKDKDAKKAKEIQELKSAIENEIQKNDQVSKELITKTDEYQEMCTKYYQLQRLQKNSKQTPHQPTDLLNKVKLLQEENHKLMQRSKKDSEYIKQKESEIENYIKKVKELRKTSTTSKHLSSFFDDFQKATLQKLTQFQTKLTQKENTLSQTLRKTNNLKSYLKQENSALKQALNTSKTTQARLKEVIDDLKLDKYELNQKLKDYDQITKQLKENSTELSELSEQNKNFMLENIKLTEEKAHSEQLIQELTQNLEESQESLKKTQHQVQSVAEEKDLLEQKLSISTSQLSENHTKKQIMDLQQQNLALETENASLQKSKIHIESSYECLSQDYKTLNQNYQNTLEELNYYQKLNDSLQTLKQENKELQTALSNEKVVSAKLTKQLKNEQVTHSTNVKSLEAELEYVRSNSFVADGSFRLDTDKTETLSIEKTPTKQTNALSELTDRIVEFIESDRELPCELSDLFEKLNRVKTKHSKRLQSLEEFNNTPSSVLRLETCPDQSRSFYPSFTEVQEDSFDVSVVHTSESGNVHSHQSSYRLQNRIKELESFVVTLKDKLKTTKGVAKGHMRIIKELQSDIKTLQEKLRFAESIDLAKLKSLLIKFFNSQSKLPKESQSVLEEIKEMLSIDPEPDSAKKSKKRWSFFKRQ